MLRRAQRNLRVCKAAGSLIIAVLLTLALPLSAACQDREKELVTLFFPRSDKSFLGLEAREVERKSALTERVREVVMSLLSGPRSKLVPAFYPETRLRQVFVDGVGTAYVDFVAEGLVGHSAGILQERLTLWSLVNTLCQNFRDIKAVKILVEGREITSLLGHIDLSYPLTPDLDLIQ